MNINTALIKQQERFYPLKDHPVQTALVKDNIRFKIVPAGRRSGKTERAKRYMAKMAMLNANRSYFVAAPTHRQAKNIWWEDLKVMTGPAHSRAPAESDLIIYLYNGTTIHVIGLDKPQRIEGQLWHGGMIDEIADIKPNAWQVNILPALNTMNPLEPDYEAWCWLIGVPDGLNHYYDLYNYALTNEDEEWKGYTWHSADILPASKIAAAKRTMSEQQFKQEYEASFETASGRIYDSYSEDNHTSETIQDKEQLHWFHDFNYSPMCSGIGVRRVEKVKNSKGQLVERENVYILDEIIMEPATSEMSTVEFCNKYKDHKNKHVFVYGDPAGKNGEKHGFRSEYTAIEKTLAEHGWRFTRKVKRKHPAIKDRQNAVRAKIKNAAGEVSLYINVDKAKWVHDGLSKTVLVKGSSFHEVEDPWQHITTAIGYFIDYEFPITRNITKNKEPQRWGHNIGDK